MAVTHVTDVTDVTGFPTFKNCDRKQNLSNREEKLVFGQTKRCSFPRLIHVGKSVTSVTAASRHFHPTAVMRRICHAVLGSPPIGRSQRMPTGRAVVSDSGIGFDQTQRFGYTALHEARHAVNEETAFSVCSVPSGLQYEMNKFPYDL